MQSRIRTVKPELFLHEELFELEKLTCLPIRVAWIGLFTCVDKEGRFEWKPNILKIKILPWDGLDFSLVLDALHSAGFIQKYRESGRIFGCIPTWKEHQTVNVKETPSKLPAPADGTEILASDPSHSRISRVADVEIPSHGEGKGTGREREKERTLRLDDSSESPGELIPTVPVLVEPSGTKEFITAYCEAYKIAHGRNPVIDGRAAGVAKRLVKSLGVRKAITLVQAFVVMPDQFFRIKSWDLLTFEANLNKIDGYADTGVLVTRQQAATDELTAANTAAINSFRSRKGDQP